MSATITVHINGNATELVAGSAVTAVLEALGIDGRGTAVAVNGEVASRSEWSTTVLGDGDRIEVLTVAQGG